MDTKSYLMGVFDGEGNICTGKNRGRQWYLNLKVEMNSLAICELFQKEWGGSVYPRTKVTAGGLTLSTWYLGASKAIPFLEYAAEHSLTKREQAVIALQLARSMAKYNWPGYRKGTALSVGKRMISDEDQAERDRLVTELRSLMGARSRYGRLPLSTYT